MKAYTDLEQSKKLAEILPSESADMHYSTWTIVSEDGEFIVSVSQQGETIEELQKEYGNQIIPCWSLAALLEIIKKSTALDLLINGRGCRCHCTDKQEGKFYGTDDYCDTPIDACVEIIIKLHEQKNFCDYGTDK